VAYNTGDKQVVIPVNLQDDAELIEAILISGILEKFPELSKIHDEDIFSLEVGIFSQPCELWQQVTEGDRIEIYNPSGYDPNKIRTARPTGIR